MDTLYAFLRTVAFSLNDDEPDAPFQRYALDKMISAYNKALGLAAEYREDLFTEYELIRLETGRYQDARSCCKKVIDVMDQARADGSLIRELGMRSTTSKVSTKWKKRSCLSQAAQGFVITSVDLDRNMDGRFIVEPPVPCGVEVFVHVKCVHVAPAYAVASVNTPIDGDSPLHAAVWHYVLAMMLSGDRFSNPANADKQYHFRMFFDMLGIVLKQGERLEEAS